MTVTTQPGTELIYAITALNRACDRIGISRPTVIAVRTMVAVHAIERELETSGHHDEITQVVGGIEVAGVAIKVAYK